MCHSYCGLLGVPLETTPSEPDSETLSLESLQETQDDDKGVRLLYCVYVLLYVCV